MVFIRKHNIKSENFYQILTEHDNILLDYHAVIYGKNHKLPSFESPPKAIKFLVKVIENANHLFITSAESFGCLFTKKSVNIYCTNPVYEQILIKYEEYLRLSLTYDEDNEIFEKMNNEKYKIVSIEEVNLEEFKNKIHFLVYNEPIRLYESKIMAMQAGTFLGWVNYKIIFQNEKSMYYLTSYSDKPRFSTKSVKIEADYLIINRRKINKKNDLKMYSELLLMICRIKEMNGNTVIIPLPIETLFIEILLHTLSIIQYYKIPIYIVSPLYKKVELLVNIQSEWLNSSICINEEPFPIREYKYLYPIEILNNEYKEAEKFKNKIIFCSDLIYKFKSKKIFDKQIDLLINYKEEIGEIIDEKVLKKLNEKILSKSYYEKIKFEIKIENSIEEIMKSTKIKIINEDNYFIKTSTDYCYMNINGNLNLVNNKLFLTGNFLFTDKYSANCLKIYIKNKNCILKQLIESEKYVIIDNCIIFYNKRIKFRILNNDKLEYEVY